MTTRAASRRTSAPGAAAAVTRGVLLLAAVAAVPWVLITLAPIPMPGTGRLHDLAREWASDPRSAADGTVSAIGRMLSQPITDQLIVQILALAVWLIWAAFLLCLLAEAGSLVSGIPAPHLPGLGGLQSAASWLLTGTLAGLLASSAVLPHPVAAPASPAPAAASMMAAPETTATALITPGHRHAEDLVYVVEPGDWLGAIAHRFLGDYNAYDVLQRANPGLIPGTAGPHGPDHIEPGWHLALPAHARDRGPEDHATGHTSAKRPSSSEANESSGASGSNSGTGSGGTGSSDESGSQDSSPSATLVTTPPSPAASTGPLQSATGSSATPAAGTSATRATETSGDAGDHDSSQDGAQFGDGWISWPLAASLAAVAALVWMARRRRYRYTEPFSYPDDSGHTGETLNEDDAFDGGNYPDESQSADQDTRQMRDVTETARLEDLNDLTSLGDGDVDEGDADSTPLYWSIRNTPPGQVADDTEDEVAARGRRTARPVARADRLAPADDDDLRPMPAALNRIRMLVQAHSAALTDPQLTSPAAPPLTPTQPPRPGSKAGHDSNPDRTTAPTRYSVQESATAAASGLPAVGPSGTQLAGLRDIPPEGAGLTGPGAADAARALLVAALTAGGPADPDAAGIVVTTFDTLNTLIGGPAAVNVEGIPRLQIAADLDSALSILDDHILTRRRTLDEHDESDLLRLREEQPWSAPMPPVLLLTQAPPATAGPIKARLSTSLHLGGPLQITGVLLGDWPRGQTIHVDATGNASIHTPGTDTRPDHPADPARRNETRLAVMGIAVTVELLAALGEAQTGQPMTLPATAPTAQAAPATPRPAPALDSGTPAELAGPAGLSGPADERALTRQHIPADVFDPAGADPAPVPPADQEPPQLEVHPEDHPGVDSPDLVSRPSGSAGSRGQERIRLRVLGAPMVLDRDGQPVPGLRSGAIQVLTILAVHRDGHPLKDIMEKMWPDAPVRRAADRLSTEAANLRRSVRIAMGRPDDRNPATNAVINTGSYYILNQDLVDIDLWQLQDLVNTAKDTTDPTARIDLLQAAIAAHAGPLADGRDYPWADVARHQIQRHAIRARLHLAQLLADDDPTEAARIIALAADADPVSEDLAQRAIRACAAAGDANGARTRLRTLRAALEEIDQEPSSETLALAANITIAKPSARPEARSASSAEEPPWGAGVLATGTDGDTPGGPSQLDRKDDR